MFGDCEVEEDEAYREDQAYEPFGEYVQGHHGGEGEAGEEGRFFPPAKLTGGPILNVRDGWGTWALVAGGGERIAVAMAHLSDDKTVAKMGHPVFHPTEQMRSLGHPVLFCFVNAVEGYEEEVDGEGHPEGE